MTGRWYALGFDVLSSISVWWLIISVGANRNLGIVNSLLMGLDHPIQTSAALDGALDRVQLG